VATRRVSQVDRDALTLVKAYATSDRSDTFAAVNDAIDIARYAERLRRRVRERNATIQALQRRISSLVDIIHKRGGRT